MALQMKNIKKNELFLFKLISKKKITFRKILEELSIEKKTAQTALKTLVKLGLISVSGTAEDRIYRKYNQKDSTLFELIVFKNGIMVGELYFGYGKYIFIYDENYKKDELEGLKKDVINCSFELFTYFENLLPEYDRRERLLQGKNNIAEILEFLTNSHGALDFIQKHKLFEYKSNYTSRKGWNSVKNKILLKNNFPNLLKVDVQIEDSILNAESDMEYSDLSGYQTKVDIDIDFKTGTIIKSKRAQYLLKPRNKNMNNYFNHNEDSMKRYSPYVAVNEHLFMSFAKNELGFNVPYSAIVKSKDIDFHYIAKRYDRIDSFKYNQVDFAQVLNLQSKDKYKTSSEELFKAINLKLSSKNAKRDALMFYYYSYLIKHADLHLKNIGALDIGRKKYILAPLYDLISVGVYNENSWDLGLNMKSPHKKPKNWNLQDFYKLGKIIGISKLNFKNEARVMTKIFITKMPKYIEMLRNFEEKNPLYMQKTRESSNKSFSDSVENMYKKRIIKLNALGVLQELSLIDIAGDLLNSE